MDIDGLGIFGYNRENGDEGLFTLKIYIQHALGWEIMCSIIIIVLF